MVDGSLVEAVSKDDVSTANNVFPMIVDDSKEKEIAVPSDKGRSGTYKRLPRSKTRGSKGKVGEESEAVTARKRNSDEVMEAVELGQKGMMLRS